MKFAKPFRSIDEQVALLVSRGMLGDAETIRRRLDTVNYYRLSAYWHSDRALDTDTLKPGTHIDTVWDRYLFDRRLRILTMDALERLEVTVRSRLAYELAREGGPFGYVTDGLLYRDDARERAACLGSLFGDFARSGEAFFRHFWVKYGDAHSAPPVWVAVEVLSFGKIVTLFRASPKAIRGAVAETLGVSPDVLDSWLICLNAIRNICAHHGRLWNRTLGARPLIPRRKERNLAWHVPVEVPNGKVFAALTILAHVLNHVAPRSGWGRRLSALFDEHPERYRSEMGFPDNWRACPIWAARLTPLNAEVEA
jgi:abortive infection bacteriophage resistance protein